MVDKVYCITTVHYVKVGTEGVSVMPAGGIAAGMSDKDFADLTKLNAVRTATDEEVAAFDEIVKKSLINAYPGSRGPTVAAKLVVPAADDKASKTKAAALKKAKAHAASLAEIAVAVQDDPDATDEAKAKAQADADAAKTAADALVEADIVG